MLHTPVFTVLRNVNLRPAGVLHKRRKPPLCNALRIHLLSPARRNRN